MSMYLDIVITIFSALLLTLLIFYIIDVKVGLIEDEIDLKIQEYLDKKEEERQQQKKEF